MAELNNDPEYCARIEQADAEQRARREALARAEAPLVDELRAAKIEVESAWELYKFPESGEVAYPILVKHLLLDYSDRVLAGIARAFTKEVARAHWSQLLTIYLTQSQGEAQDGLAATLSGCATRAHYDDLVSVIENESLGETRIYFLRPLNRIGNRLVAGAGRAVIGRFADDPILGVESKRILRGKSRNDWPLGHVRSVGSTSRSQATDHGEHSAVQPRGGCCGRVRGAPVSWNGRSDTEHSGHRDRATPRPSARRFSSSGARRRVASRRWDWCV